MDKYKFICKYGLYISFIFPFIFLGCVIFTQGYMVYSKLSIILTIISYVMIIISIINIEVMSRYKFKEFHYNDITIIGQSTFRHNYLIIDGKVVAESENYIKRLSPTLKANYNGDDIMLFLKLTRSTFYFQCFVNDVEIYK